MRIDNNPTIIISKKEAKIIAKSKMFLKEKEKIIIKDFYKKLRNNTFFSLSDADISTIEHRICTMILTNNKYDFTILIYNDNISHINIIINN